MISAPGMHPLITSKNLPIDRLKIDQSYAKRLEDIKSRKLLKTMIQMAHELSFEVTVEGVETREQFEIIKTFGTQRMIIIR